MNIKDLAGLSQPITLFIQKIADATGGVCRPWQTLRVADAEARAEVIRAKAKIEIGSLEERAVNRFVYEQIKQQANIEQITQKAFPQITDDAKPDLVENDWVTHFLEKCRLISDEDLQKIWAKLLAGQMNKPGKFSKRSIDWLAAASKHDAETLVKLRNIVCEINGISEAIQFEHHESVKFDLFFCRELESSGLLSIADGMNYIRANPKPPQQFEIRYFDSVVKVTKWQSASQAFCVGRLNLSQTGKELISLCNGNPIPEFFTEALRNMRQWNHIETEPPISSVTSPATGSVPVV